MSEHEDRAIEPVRRYLYDKTEMAASIAVSVATLDDMRRRGCPSIPVPGCRRVIFDPADVVAWLKEQDQRDDSPSLSAAEARLDVALRKRAG